MCVEPCGACGFARPSHIASLGVMTHERAAGDGIFEWWATCNILHISLYLVISRYISLYLLYLVISCYIRTGYREVSCPEEG